MSLGFGFSLPAAVAAGAAAAASPAVLEAQILALFAAGEQGVWFDPSDLSTLFQDTAGTTPVTAPGQSVARINDKSGRGNHATQAAAGSRPLMQVDASGKRYLDFDGVDDFLQTGNVNLTTTDKLTVFAGVGKNADVNRGILIEQGTGALQSFTMNAPNINGGPNYDFVSRGSAAATILASPFTAPITNVLAASGDIANDICQLRVNGVPFNIATDQGTGAYSNLPLFIGRRSGTTFPLTGRVYSLIVRGAASSVAQITSGEAYVGGKTGAY